MPWMRSASARADGNSVRYRHADGRYDHRVRPITVQLQEETSLAEFQWCGAFLVVVGHMVDSGAYGIEGDRRAATFRMPCWHPSCPDQATGRGSWIKNDRHTVVGGYGHCIGVVVRIEHVSMAFPLRPSISPIFPQTRFIDSYSSVQASKEKHQARIVAE